MRKKVSTILFSAILMFAGIQITNATEPEGDETANKSVITLDKAAFIAQVSIVKTIATGLTKAINRQY
ncbi:hypothetical protein [Marinilabilia sp.]|uniref:hypothetical protein n=1 Tax=Marinilabilia sp. TaxID=2021252 RepID=UPI0025BE1CB3|nr:hypothetical protein [Marinilabilia sp.]